MTRRPIFFVLTALLLALGGLALLAGSLSAPAQAAPGAGSALSEIEAPARGPAAELHVCPSGCAYSSVQAAVDAANDGDVIKVAAGTYTGVSARQGVTQVVYIDKSVTVRGGYTTANWNTPDPDANPTILDAQGQGRVLCITGWSVNTTIEGLHITGGDATGLGGQGSYDAGGGVYAGEYAAAIFNDNEIFGNTADFGGGMYVGYSYPWDATLSNNTVSGNSADYYGGGLDISGNATLIGNTISGNSAAGFGGGVYVNSDDVTLIGNTVSGNSADDGGGLSVSGDATLTGNTISGNSAASSGGGLYVYGSAGVLHNNTIVSNTSQDYGGGIDIVSSRATVISNAISGNTSHYAGGGVSLLVGADVLNGNSIRGNEAEDYGGAIYLNGSEARLDNNVVADNVLTDTWGSVGGSGLCLSFGSSPILRHNTIARNRGSGDQGIYLDDSSSAALINTILVSHTVGLYAEGGAQATLTGTLWGSGEWANGANASGAGTVISSTNVTGAPAFVDPGSGDYHVGATSAAIDRGVDAGVLLDVDGEYRPPAAPPDLGADERVAAPTCRARLNGGGTIYSSIQAALDASTSSSDVVQVAGVCEDAVSWRDETRVAVLDRTLTLRGGYSLDFSTWDPATYPTVLNGRLQGGVLAIGAGTHPTVEYLTLLGGATVEGGGAWSRDAAPVLRHLRVTHNVAGRGGGIYLEGGSGQVIDNSVEANQAAGGGGLYLMDGEATVTGNAVSGNTGEDGGGLYLDDCDATVSGNTIRDNTARSRGGGLFVYGDLTLDGNTISSNVANGNYFWEGGGGLYLWYNDATLRGNVIVNNVAAQSNGGGLFLCGGEATLINNVVADNQAYLKGLGVYVYGASPRLFHTTIARNRSNFSSGVYLNEISGGGAAGIDVTENSSGDPSTVWLANTILVSHTVGIWVNAGNTATLEGTLWGSGAWANTLDWVDWAATIFTGTVNVWGDPAFAGAGDYHLTAGSDAIDAGVDAGVSSDLDLDLRPIGAGFDIGADEFPLSGTADPGTSSSLTYVDTQGSPTTLDVPAGAVTESTTIRYAPKDPQAVTGVPPDLAFGNHAFDLAAYRGGSLIPGFTFEKAVKLTVEYSDADVAGLDEETLALYRRTGSGWEEIGERPPETYTLDVENNVLTAYLLGFSRFSTMGAGVDHRVFLPLVLRNR